MISLARFWMIRGRITAVRPLVDRALALAGDTTNSLAGVRRAEGIGIGAELPRFQGDLDTAAQLKEEAIELLRSAAPEHPLRAGLLSDLGSIRARQDDVEGARRVHDEALALRRERGDPFGIAHALAGLGEFQLFVGEYLSARDTLTEAYQLTQEHGSAEYRANAALGLGEVLRRLGDTPRARELLSEGLSISLEIGEQMLVAESLASFGALANDEGDPGRAARLLGASETLRDRIGVVQWDPREHERVVGAVREGLGAREFELNRRLRRAALLAGPRRFTTYGKLDIDISRLSAPWASLYNTNSRDLVASRIGCYVYQPVYAAMDLAAACLK